MNGPFSLKCCRKNHGHNIVSGFQSPCTMRHVIRGPLEKASQHCVGLESVLVRLSNALIAIRLSFPSLTSVCLVTVECCLKDTCNTHPCLQTNTYTLKSHHSSALQIVMNMTIDVNVHVESKLKGYIPKYTFANGTNFVSK